MLKRILAYFKQGADKALRVSFLPEEKVTGWNMVLRYKNLTALALIIILIILLVIWGFFVLTAQGLIKESAEINKNLSLTERRIEQKFGELEKIRAISARIAPAKNLLANHSFWTNFFEFLEKNTIQNITFKNIAADANGVIITGTAANYEAIARQILAFISLPVVKDLKISGIFTRISPKGEILGIDFTLNMQIDESLLKPYK